MKTRAPMAALLSLLLAGVAQAHVSGVSTSEIDLEPSGRARARLAVAALELAALAPVDRDGDGRINQTEVEAQRAHFEQLAPGLLELSADGKPCAARLATLQVGPERDGVDLFVDYTCSPEPRHLEAQALLLAAFPLSHKHSMLLRAGSATRVTALGGPLRHAELDTPYGRGMSVPAWLLLGTLVVGVAALAWRGRHVNA